MRFYFLVNNELLEKSIDFILSWGLDVCFRTLLTCFYIPHFFGLYVEVFNVVFLNHYYYRQCSYCLHAGNS